MRLCESRPWSRLRLDLVLGSKWLQVSIKNGITAILMYEGLHIKYANITLDHITKCHEENFQVCVCGGGGARHLALQSGVPYLLLACCLWWRRVTIDKTHCVCACVLPSKVSPQPCPEAHYAKL